jgi:hypothetical protein
MAGYSGKSIVQKLGIKPGFRIFTAGLPLTYSEIVGSLPDAVKIVARPTAPLDMVHVFATEAATLGDKLSVYSDAIAPDGMVWVSWPKKSSGVPHRSDRSCGSRGRAQARAGRHQSLRHR